MKIYSLFLTLFLTLTLYVTGWAQPKVYIHGDNSVEVGKKSIFTAKFYKNGTEIDSIVSYEFKALSIGEFIPGESGILGSINGDSTHTTITIDTNASNISVPVIWGDRLNTISEDYLYVAVTYRKGTYTYTVYKDTIVIINRVCKPKITGPSSIQKCCIDPVTYIAKNVCDADTFAWKIVSGGTITGGAGTSTITVVPSTTNNIILICTASRTTGLAIYTRSDTTTITRTNPVTPAVTSPDYFCIGSNYEICVGKICGMSSVDWFLPPTLQIIGDQHASCITVSPVSGTVGGTMGKITAQIVMSGGCIATVSPEHNFTIYSAETPPTPQGYITIELDGGTPCNDPTYKVVWHPSNPYLNGYTSVSPGVILGGVHPPSPHGEEEPVRQIKITVCYVNLCSGKKNCIEFLVDPPQPCLGAGLFVHGDGQETTPAPDTIGERLSVDDIPTHQDILIFPNPSTGFFSVKHVVTGELSVYESTGRLIDRTTLQPGNASLQFPTANPLQRGVYLVEIKTNTATITQKLIVQ